MLLTIRENNDEFNKMIDQCNVPSILLGLMRKRPSFTILHIKIYDIFSKVFELKNKDLIITVLFGITIVYYKMQTRSRANKTL